MALPFKYHWRNLLIRKTTTTLTLLVVALVVGVFAWLAGFYLALRSSLSFANDDQKIIVLKAGATSETNSAIPPDEYNKLAQLDAIARDSKTGELLQSPEMTVQVSLPRLRDGGKTFANVAVRGVTETAFRVHRNVRRLGAGFSTGTPEVIVGEAAARQFGGLAIGDVVDLGYGGQRGYRVVGYFSANGGPMESEIWGYLPSLMDSYNRTMYSSVNIRIADGADATPVLVRIRGPGIEMEGKTETVYWQEQSKNVVTYLRIVSVLVVIMCIAAGFSIANTMFATIAGRVREFAMLRTIGYSPGQILTSVLVEAVMLTLLGGILGCTGCAAWLAFAGGAKDMFTATTFTTMAFDVRMDPMIVVFSLGLVSVVGLLGALVPSIRASHLPVLGVLREA